MILELGTKFGLEEYTTSVQTAKYTNKDDDERFVKATVAKRQRIILMQRRRGKRLEWRKLIFSTFSSGC